MQQTYAYTPETQPEAKGLDRKDFRSIATNGWGDGYNNYLHSMAWFKGTLYAGSFRANLCMIRNRNPPPQYPVYPVECPSDPFTLDLRAQLRRYDPLTTDWNIVQKSPIVKDCDGKDIPREISYRGMSVAQLSGDTETALYVSTFSPTRSTGPLILRSEDGVTFDPISKPGLGLEKVSSFRFLVPYKGRLYTSPVGSTGNNPNFSRYPTVYECLNTNEQYWRPVSEPGFGDPSNTVVFEMTVFNGLLYAGTFNADSGFQIWKTDACGAAPYRWQQVLSLGAYRRNFNQGAISMCSFRDALYIGTGIQDGGYDRANKLGPSAGEIIRIHPDDSWDLVVGSPRLTPVGLKLPTSGLHPGFNDFFNGYMWRMCVHDGCLYMGTFNWCTFLPYIPLDKWPVKLRELVEAMGVDEIIKTRAGFDLWKTCDGDTWTPISTRGFDNKYNCGARSFASTPLGLVVGTANPFGPKVAQQRNGQWEYVENTRGGLEAWLGTQPSQEQHECDKSQLRALAQKINIGGVMPNITNDAYRFHEMEVKGIEHVHHNKPAIIISNHCATPLLPGTNFITEDCLVTLNVLASYLTYPARLMADKSHFTSSENIRLSQSTIESLGYVPATTGNAIRLLEMGETVLIYPEINMSHPGYRLRPFSLDFAKIALLTGVPVIPLAFLGPHESRIRVESRGVQIILNKQKPLKAKYKLIFLPPTILSSHLLGNDDEKALLDFSTLLQCRMQSILDREASKRPLARWARQLQEKYGDPLKGNEV